MNKKSLFAVAVASFVATFGSLNAEDTVAAEILSQNDNNNTMSNTTSKLDFIEQNGQKFIHVSTIGTVEANR